LSAGVGRPALRVDFGAATGNCFTLRRRYAQALMGAPSAEHTYLSIRFVC
jgi:hypothetical protein